MRAAALAAATLLAATPGHAARVPFVGCPSDGQLGPQPAPAPRPPPDVSAPAAAELAYYAMADGPAVLAPRGWQCFGSYGSNGATLYVAPSSFGARPGFTPVPHGGPLVQLSLSNGGTSGRFEVAEVAARLFPAARAFVDAVEAEGILDHKLIRSPYPADRIVRDGPYRVRYTTPASAIGLGNRQSFLARGPSPIEGAAIYDPKDDDSLTFLAVRLPPAMRPLAATIVREVEGRR